MLETVVHSNTAIPTFPEIPSNYRLIRKCTLSNQYGMYYDLYGNVVYISPEAENSSRREWRGFAIKDEYYIYV